MAAMNGCKDVKDFNFVHLNQDTIVCRASQEAGMPHRECINTKKENVIYTPM